LPLFTGTSSETFRKVPDRVQIDTTPNRQNGIQNHALNSTYPGINRTAVISDRIFTDVCVFELALYVSTDKPLVYCDLKIVIFSPFPFQNRKAEIVIVYEKHPGEIQLS
jgi:hypothetical protein